MKRRIMGGKRKLIPHILRISSSTTLTVSSDWEPVIDLFLVGGGGSGGSWKTWFHSMGGGGAGGECVTVKNISVSEGDKLYIAIGSGGQGVKYGENNGNTGGSTSVTINDKKYTARGGQGGLHSLYKPTSLETIALNATGYDKRSDGIGAANVTGDTGSSTIFNICHPDGEIIVNSEDMSKYTCENPFQLTLGVPEFHEKGSPLHAGGGAGGDGLIQVLTSFTKNKGGDYISTYYKIHLYGGGGFGGGGAGGWYDASVNSGTGGSGGVVIRYYTYEQ